MRMVGAYAMIDSSSRKIQPTLIDRIQDRYGRTHLQARPARVPRPAMPKWANQGRPTLIDKRERMIDPMTAIQILHHGGGAGAPRTAAGSGIRRPGQARSAGKTGTTNDEKDVTVVSLDLVVACSMPACHGLRSTAAHLRPRPAATTARHACRPRSFRDFMKVALADEAGDPAFNVPRHQGSSASM